MILNRANEIRQSFPKPLAKAFAHAELALECTEGARSYLDAFEATAQYLALTATARYLASSRDNKQLEGPLAEVLPRPSFGGWVRLVRELDKLSREGGASYFGSDLTEKRELPSFAKLSKELDGSGGSKHTLMGVFDKITNIRNKVAHQKLSPQELGGLLALLRDTLAELLCSIPSLREQSIVQAVRVENVRQGFKATLRLFQGEGMPRQEEKITPQPLISGSLYLQDKDSLIELWPLFLASAGEVVLFGGLEGKASKPLYFPTSVTLPQNELNDAATRLREQCPFLFEPRPEQSTQEVPRSLLKQIDKALSANQGKLSDEDRADIEDAASDFGLSPALIAALINERMKGLSTANIQPPIRAAEPIEGEAHFFLEGSVGRYELIGDLRIGRAPGNQIVLQDPATSSNHANISLKNGEVLLDDLGSRFGTLLNKEKVVTTRRLQHNDQVQIGNIIFWLRVERGPLQKIAQLTVQEGNERGRCVKGSHLTVGRDATRCQLVLTDSAVSSAHLDIIREGDGFVVIDKGSRNGSILRGKKLSSQPTALQSGDTLILGGAVMVLFQELAPPTPGER